MREIFDEIRRRLRLADYLSSQFGVVIGRGGMASCPLHEDKTPSMHVIDDSRWYCFSCGEGGDAVDFVSKKLGLPIMEAAKRVAGEVGVELTPQEEARIRAYRDLQDRTGSMLTKASQELSDDLAANIYLENRHMTPDAVKQFGLGFRPDLNAISIPINDRFNRLVGYSMRLLDPKEGESKYKNSRADDLGLFQKKEILYNLGSCRKNIKDRVYIAEGYFDVISLWILGVEAPIGICQAIMTKEQAAILHEAIKPETEIVFVPDNDRAGLEALQKNIALLRGYSKERSIKVAKLPAGSKDANDALVSDPVTAKDLILKPAQAEMVLLERLIDLETDKTKQYQLARPITSSVSPLLRDDLLDFLSKKWEKDKRLLVGYFGDGVKDADASSFNGAMELVDSYSEYLKHINQRGIHFNIPCFDRLIRRIPPGEVCYIQARTSVGKTALLLNLLAALSQQGHKILFFSLEMQKEPIFERMMQISNRLSNGEIERLVSTGGPKLGIAYNNFYELFKNVWVVDRPGLTMAQIREYIHQFSLIHDFPQVVAVDYFGYIRTPGKGDVYERTSELAKEIKATAKELNNQWIVLHQLSRAGGTGGEPVTLDMGRDTGVLEESGDQIIGAWRPEFEKDITESERIIREQAGIMKAAVLKNRSGPTGIMDLRFEKHCLRIDDLERAKASPPNEGLREDHDIQETMNFSSTVPSEHAGYTQDPDEGN